MRYAILLILAILLSACATPGPWGNYASARPSQNTRMAEDSFNQLKSLYPPAKTRLTIDQPVDDPFGMVLVDRLRKAGYGVAETRPSKTKKGTDIRASVTGIPFHYVVDHIAGAGYRVSLRVGTEMLSRVYQASGNDLIPAGYWAKQQ